MNIGNKLKIASYLARCQKAIDQLRKLEPLEDPEWVLNLFSMSGANEDSGRVSFFLARENKDSKNLEKIFIRTYELNDKIFEKKELSADDYKFILESLLAYRSHLLMKSSWMSQCTCEF